MSLDDPTSPLLSDRMKVALRYAEQMTEDSRQVSDALFIELSHHFSEGAILELTAVVGLFNYFNRFNNALAMDITK